MHRLLLALALAGLVIGSPNGALAKSRPSQGACTWSTSFSGARERLSELFGKYDYYRASRCFSTQASCKAWLYNIQTAYPLMMDFRPCHRG